ncbi:hypothetical protein [Xanthomonas bromi]|nr:hypothetical protein [Xanthomonas bromi]
MRLPPAWRCVGIWCCEAAELRVLIAEDEPSIAGAVLMPVL